jgi:membrane associated rhomboid family serine protease
MSDRQPALNIPAGVVATALLLILVHLVRISLPAEQGFDLLLALAFIPARYAGSVPGLTGGDLSAVTSFVTYMLVHGDWTHLTVNTVWMLAFGSAVARRIGSLRFFLFSALCGIAGALVHLVLHFGEAVPVVGASAAISGQMAGAVRFMFGAGRAGASLPRDLSAVPLAGVGETLANPRFLLFLGVWVALNILFGLGGMQLDGSGGSIAWEAHIGGFVCGLLVFGTFDRGVRSDRQGPFAV